MKNIHKKSVLIELSAIGITTVTPTVWWALILLFAISAAAQTNAPTAADLAERQKEISRIELKEQIRAQCLEGRRSICGKILRILPDGVLVEAGYTNLLRAPLTKSWLIPATVVASPAQNLIEGKNPGAICVGNIFLTDLPRGKPHLYDYVIVAGYPTGTATYTSVGTVKKTVRRFSANLDKAVAANLAVTNQLRAVSSETK
ncbi:MAG TPA: hypothetical protein VHC44_14185 [Verrucomicrobiae bacterium]|nr:hypothetical protein [Verrucomicrobiae bacterium]